MLSAQIGMKECRQAVAFLIKSLRNLWLNSFPLCENVDFQWFPKCGTIATTRVWTKRGMPLCVILRIWVEDQSADPNIIRPGIDVIAWQRKAFYSPWRADKEAQHCQGVGLHAQADSFTGSSWRKVEQLSYFKVSIPIQSVMRPIQQIISFEMVIRKILILCFWANELLYL